jgi:hypothetical protein
MANDYTFPTIPDRIGEGGTGMHETGYGSLKAFLDQLAAWGLVAVAGIEKYEAVANAGPTSGSAISVTDMEAGDDLEKVIGITSTSALLSDETANCSIRAADGYLLASADLSGKRLIIKWAKGA